MIRWAILTVSIVLIFANGYAYAETFEEHIKFPIPDNVTEQAKMCSIEKMDEKEFIFDCKWRFTADGVEEWYEETLKQYEIINPACEFGVDELTGDCLDEIILPIPSNFIPEEKPEILKKYEAAIIYFENNEPKTKDELDYFYQLQFLAECQQGQDQARGIQNDRSVVYSEFSFDSSIPRAGHITGTAGDLKIAIQECLGEIILLELVGYERADDDIRSRQSYFGEPQKYHGDVVIYDKEFWESIPIHSTNSLKLTDDAFEVEEKTAWQKMCDSELVDNSFKLQQGCAIDYSVGLDLDGTCRDYTILNEDKTRCIPIPSTPRTDGGLPLYNHIQDAYDRYRNLGEDEQLSKIQNQLRIDQERQRLAVENVMNER